MWTKSLLTSCQESSLKQSNKIIKKNPDISCKEINFFTNIKEYLDVPSNNICFIEKSNILYEIDSDFNLNPEHEILLYKHQLNQRQSANARERSRTFHVNKAFNALRDFIPTKPANRKLSKIETLHLAISYIAHLSTLLQTNDINNDHDSNLKIEDVDDKILNMNGTKNYKNLNDTNIYSIVDSISNGIILKECCLECELKNQDKIPLNPSSLPIKRGRKPYKSRVTSLAHLRNQNDYRYCTFCAFNNYNN